MESEYSWENDHDGKMFSSWLNDRLKAQFYLRGQLWEYRILGLERTSLVQLNLVFCQAVSKQEKAN